MALIPTDFPCPVAPATNKWGILVKSATRVSLLIVFPRANGNSISASWNFLELIKAFIETIFLFLFGTSIPIVPFPGIGAIILMPRADNDKAMSSSKLLIFDILIPASGTISYNVTVGPMVAFILSIPIL